MRTKFSTLPSVYTISCKDKNVKDFYIGSCNNFNNRYKEHKYGALHDIPRQVNQMFVYKMIRANGGWSNWVMKSEVFLEYDCDWNTRRELEQIYIDLLQPTLNRARAIGQDEERKKKYNTNYNRIKAFCPICKELMLKKSIKRHVSRKHSQFCFLI